MASEIRDLDHLCIHTITTKPLEFEVACAKYAALGVKGISIWRDAVCLDVGVNLSWFIPG